MITPVDFEKYDSLEMHKIYNQWPEIAKKAYESNYEEISCENINHIVFAGVGGSGAIGDLFSSILSKKKIHVTLVKGYLLPKTVDKNTLVVVISISGNSKEPLTILESAVNVDCSLIAFSSGGKIEKFCSEHNIDFRKIEMIHSPRTSFVQYVYSILKILTPILPISKNDIKESISELQKICHKNSSDNLTDTNMSLTLAKWISGIPLIYFPHGLQSTAIRFKSSLQENSKIHVIVEDIIETCHNGIVAWERQSIVQPILIRGYDDYIKTQERWEIVKKYFSDNKIDFKEIISIDGNILSKLIVLIYILDYASIYKAILDKTDPSPVKSIDFIKKYLK